MALLFVLLLSIQGLIDGMAQDHADELLHSEELYHSNIAPLFASRGGPCEWAGEVIYRGGDPDARWAAYAASPSHDQVVNTPRTHHGVGIVQSESGVYTVVDIFCRAAQTTTTSPPTTSPTTAPPTTSPPATYATTTAPPPVTTTTEAAPTVTQVRPPLCPALGRICIN